MPGRIDALVQKIIENDKSQIDIPSLNKTINYGTLLALATQFDILEGGY